MRENSFYLIDRVRSVDSHDRCCTFLDSLRPFVKSECQVLKVMLSLWALDDDPKYFEDVYDGKPRPFGTVAEGYAFSLFHPQLVAVV